MLVEAILRCLIKLVHLLDKGSIFFKHLFWISVVVMQVRVCVCVCVHICGSTAKWSGHWLSNQIVAGLIPAQDTWPCCFLKQETSLIMLSLMPLGTWEANVKLQSMSSDFRCPHRHPGGWYSPCASPPPGGFTSTGS